MYIESKYLERAAHLHKHYPVVDAHLDLAAELYFRLCAGEKHPLRDQYLNDLKAGGFNLIVSSVFLENEQRPEGGLRTSLDQISILLDQIDENEDFLLVRTAEDLEQAIEEDRIGILLYMEGLDCIGNDLHLLRILWELGVRGASLTWSRRNALGNGCCYASQRIQSPGGLSQDGFRAVEQMERMGMFLDISHLNDDGFDDVCRRTEKPFIATHSDSQSVYFTYRNLTDEQILRLTAKGGMIGLNGCRNIAGCEHGEDVLETLCRHVEHIASLAGTDRVGFGFDFCDSLYDAEPKYGSRKYYFDCLENHSHVPELTAALLQRGMDEEDAKKVIGGNWVEYFRKMLPKRK